MGTYTTPPPPLRLNLFFRFLRDGDVGVCSPSRRVFLIAVLLKMKRAHSTSPKAHKKGGRGGSSIEIVLFLRGFFIFVPSFLLYMWVYARASCSCSFSCHKSSWAHPRRGTWPDFVFVFVVSFVSRMRTKIGPPQKSKTLHL